jgi:hypothetical protein
MAKSPKHHRKPWTKKELATLKKTAARRPVGVIANELGRTAAAIRAKANAEGFSMKPAKRKRYGR